MEQKKLGPNVTDKTNKQTLHA